MGKAGRGRTEAKRGGEGEALVERAVAAGSHAQSINLTAICATIIWYTFVG
jgi:hypothetical protein